MRSTVPPPGRIPTDSQGETSESGTWGGSQSRRDVEREVDSVEDDESSPSPQPNVLPERRRKATEDPAELPPSPHAKGAGPSSKKARVEPPPPKQKTSAKATTAKPRPKKAALPRAKVIPQSKQ